MKQLIEIYTSFFKMGAVTFGGGYAMLPILRSEIVQKKQWLSEEEIMDFYAISQGLPGIIAVNVSAFIGYARKKEIGAFSAVMGCVSPCIIIITLIAALLSGFQDNKYVQSALGAVSVCVCALIVDSIMAMWKKGVKDFFGIAVFAAMLALMVFTEISPIILVVVSALLGIVVKSLKNAKGGKA